MPPVKTKTLKRMIDMYLRGVPVTEIARRCGHAVSTVHRHLSGAGVTRSRSEAARLAHSRRIPRKRILALYQMGLAGTAVAQILGISHNTVYRVLRQEGVSRPPRLSAPRQHEIRRRIMEAGRLKAEGLTYDQVAERLGISRATAVRYVSRYRKMLRPS
jgi:transposase